MENPTAINVLFSTGKILLAFLLVLLNGLFVAAEFSFVKVRPTRISQLVSEGNRKAALVQECINKLDAYLSVSQLGITLSSLGLGWLGEPAVAALLSPLLFKWGINTPALVHSISFIFAFALITFLHVVFGELAPKTLAIQKSEAISLWLAGPMRAFFYIFYPAVLLLNGTANKIVMLMGLQSESDNERIHSEEELRMLISESYRGGQINKSEQELLQNVFRFENRVVEEIMVPRPEVVFMDTQKSLDENLAIARNFGHTRFPLCDGSPDCIIGQINIKDLIAHEGELKDLHQIRRDISFVTEVMPLDKLLPEFQKRKQHMAVVLDEYGGTAGIVTMENVLEELVGEIQDEFDNEEPEVIVEDSGNLLVSGRMLIEDAVERFDLAINEEEQEQYNTLAGFVLGKLGKRPREKDIVRQENLCMEVVKMEGMRIDRIRIRKLHERQTTPDTYLGN